MYQVSLISGVLPWVIGTIAFASFAVVLARWPRRLWWSIPVAFVVAVGLLIAISWSVQLPRKLHGTWPRSFFAWSAAPIVAVVATILAWRDSRIGHRVAGVLAIAFLIVFAADRVDVYYGALPTVGAALRVPLPGELATAVPFRPTTTQTRAPATGVVFSLRIPGTVSHFRARPAYVWLPPVWFSRPRPRLPALELVAGSPSFPGDWLYGGQAVRTLDAYAKTHHGRGPIVVVADQNGSFLGDTECVDGPRGRADTYISVDVIRSADRLFGVAPGPRSWTIAGYSAGGTCALVVALRHPTVYGAFGDFSGDPRPNTGPWSSTLHDLFGGSLTLSTQYNPFALLRTRHYRNLLAWFDTGRRDAAYRVAGMRQLALLARRAGAHVIEQAPPGSHTFYFWQQSLQAALPSLLAATTHPARLVEVASAKPLHPIVAAVAAQ
ncbi:MAG TPA: alpha/beta hydrolase-fold protein [Acidimicrobiia bacterium]